MIISQLTGGLGNQMFQYAFGYSVARKNKTQFRYVYQNIEGNTKREFELLCFKISGQEATRKELMATGYPFTRLGQLLVKMRIKKQSLFKEKAFQFDKNALEVNGNLVLQGYWQSEKYFKMYRKDIQNEFAFVEAVKGKNRIIAKQMQSQNSVAVHVRRGDYAHDASANAYHGLCSVEYYKKGMKAIENQVKNPTYYFFSDEPSWVKANLSTENKSYYIDWNTGSNSYRDMQLMTLCKHNIIANSSFSWWSAWLNKDKNKMVIAPKQWFSSQLINTNDLLPESWLKI